MVDRLRAYREAMKKEAAGIANDAEVDTGLIKLPKKCLFFPGKPESEQDIDYTKLRDGHAVSRTFKPRGSVLQ